ncbi:subtilase-type protease inhibitor [Streptomyces sp. ISL-11]|uniref:subtilase-type protease inhibitor n=1 Tax=Streptomyces sp. ISL-11 TaxID=2819174 RepID=UPI001BE55791|nr:subtilase-type protease inhibitor [Streptomyces sp. ISL-11]MBT2387036.1 subtilase-type protease inhibitor [Streptomyces sp. ISL-11]
MRYITKGIALGATLALGGLVAAGTTAASAAPATTTAPAAQTSLYAPSALVLTMGSGASRDDSGVQRAVTLTCMPKAAGTHPAAKDACTQLRSAGGDFDKVTAVKADTICTKEWNPIVVTAEGVWEGRRVNYEHTFANPCAFKAGKGTVFEF